MANIESSDCTNVYGQDNEWNVAQTLWDLYDSAPESNSWGADFSSYGSDNINPASDSIWGVMWSGSEPRSLGDFRAQWLARGYNEWMFSDVAHLNGIWFEHNGGVN